jgi:hypothetical protein
MVTRDKELDYFIRDSLRNPVTAHQKRVALERLMQAASQQLVLPCAVTPAPRWNRMKSYSLAVGRWLGSLMDETHYERARQYRLAYPSWTNGYGGSGLAIQICEPGRYPLGVPV